GDAELLLGNRRAGLRCFRASKRKRRCESVARRVHANERIINSVICAALKCRWSNILFGSAGALRSPCQLRIAPVDAFQHIAIWAVEIDTAPDDAEGQMNLRRPKRLAYSAKPMHSAQGI